MGAHRLGAVGAAGGVLVERADAPDTRAGAVHLSVVAGPDVVAVPGAVRQAAEAACDAPLQERKVPAAVLGERLQRLQLGTRPRPISDWVMVCSSVLRARPVTHSTKR